MIDKDNHNPYNSAPKEWGMARQIGKIQKHRERWRIRLPGRIDIYVGRDGRTFDHKATVLLVNWLFAFQENKLDPTKNHFEPYC